VIGPRGGEAIGLRAARSPGGFDRYAVGLHHLAIRVDSRPVVDERAAWLRSIGAEIESGPAEYDYSPGYAVFSYDPDGLELELHSPRP
jgi:catechol 2,3-dioxygenase-like lactoylglutathione lyase family enzyme